MCPDQLTPDRRGRYTLHSLHWFSDASMNTWLHVTKNTHSFLFWFVQKLHLYQRQFCCGLTAPICNEEMTNSLQQTTGTPWLASSSLSFLSPPDPEEKLWGKWHRFFRCPSCYPTNSVKALKESQGTNPNQLPAFILIHWKLDSWQKWYCSLLPAVWHQYCWSS